jgi:nucleoside-diphosphate-sugar epimerase
MSVTEPRGDGETVLVTGGSGFLGSWCVIEALRRGYRVRTTVRSLSREPQVRAMLGGEIDAGERLSFAAADLTADAGWDEAVSGCDYVLHVASPFPPAQPKDPDELIVPAREGTRRVLAAALAAGAKRVVVTSSVAAVRNAGDAPPRPLTEEDWTDPSNPQLTPYARSKTIAEQAAWELVRGAGQEARLSVVNPSAILGPVLANDLSYSLEVVQRMLNGMPGVPRLGFSFVDVRDVAALQVTAMAAPEAAGERFLAAGPFHWLSEVAQILSARLGPAAHKVPHRTVPNVLVRAMALVDPGLRSVVGDLGREVTLSSDKAKARLGWTQRPFDETVVDTAHGLIQHGAITQKAA